MNSYCVKCKAKTSTNDVNVVKTSNGKYQAKGTCARCHNKKATFISAKDGKGLLGKLFFPSTGKVPGLNKIPLVGDILF